MGSEEDTGSNSNREKEDKNDEESESSSDSEKGPKGPNIPPNPPPSDSAVNTNDRESSPKKDEKRSDNDYKNNWESHVYQIKQSEYNDSKKESEGKDEKESKWNAFQFNYQSYSQNYS